VLLPVHKCLGLLVSSLLGLWSNQFERIVRGDCCNLVERRAVGMANPIFSPFRLEDAR
jgi:hypothetical protein